MSLSAYLDAIKSLKGEQEVRRLRHQVSFLCKGIDFAGKTVLEIGGGTGYHALYTAAMGANLERAVNGS